MNKLRLYKAQEGGAPVQPIEITISEPIPEMKDLNVARVCYAEEATALADALWKALPGGTLSALFAEMCERYRNLFRVPQ